MIVRPMIKRLRSPLAPLAAAVSALLVSTTALADTGSGPGAGDHMGGWGGMTLGHFIWIGGSVIVVIAVLKVLFGSRGPNREE